MKDSKQVRDEYQSFVDAYKQISERADAQGNQLTDGGQEFNSVPEPEKTRRKWVKGNPKGEKTIPLGGDRRPNEMVAATYETVTVRKENAFTEQAEKYQMSVKQFAKYVEANQLLFSVDTRKKAQVANAFQGFKETAEWDEFFGDLEENVVKKIDTALGNYGKAAERTVKKVVKTGAQAVGKVGAEIHKGYQSGMSKEDIEALDNLYKLDEYTITQADVNAKTPAYKGFKAGATNKVTGKPLYTLAPHVRLANSNELEGEELKEVTTKETKTGTKYKVRVKQKDSNSSYIRYATREMIAQMRNDPKIASVEMTDEGDAPEDKGEKKAQDAGGGSPTGHQGGELSKGEGLAAKVKKKRSVTTEEKKEEVKKWHDDDDDGISYEDGEVDGSFKKKKKLKKEGFSDWRGDLLEITDDEDLKKKIQEKNVKNKVEIMPQLEAKQEDCDCDCGKVPCVECGGNHHAVKEHHQKDADGNTIPHEETKTESVGAALLGGALATGIAAKGIQTAIKIKNNLQKGTGPIGKSRNKTSNALKQLNQETEVKGDSIKEAELPPEVWKALKNLEAKRQRKGGDPKDSPFPEDRPKPEQKTEEVGVSTSVAMQKAIEDAKRKAKEDDLVKKKKDLENSNELEGEVVQEADTLAATVERWEAARQKRMKQRQAYERPHWIPRDQDHEDNWGSSKGVKEEVQLPKIKTDVKMVKGIRQGVLPLDQTKIKNTKSLKGEETVMGLVREWGIKSHNKAIKNLQIKNRKAVPYEAMFVQKNTSGKVG